MMDREARAIGFDTSDMIEPISITLREMLATDGRIFVPNHAVKEIYFGLNVDVQIKLTNGETVMIFKKAEGNLIRTPGIVNGHPTMTGTIHVYDK